ncbi:MAG: hypothetical protein GQ574_07530 [Crocinitomix sp.]|nr:hypothetical protein [Crocinitomix sp.]
MKLKTIKLTLICGAIFLLAACNANSENETEGSDEVATTLADSNDPEDPNDPCNTVGNLRCKEIESDSAVNYINAYNAYINNVKSTLSASVPVIYPNTSSTLIYGVGTTIAELREIIDNSELDDDSELWIMLGMEDDSTTEMYFGLDGTNKLTLEEEWQFYDFTKPCPNSCPTLPSFISN